MTELIGDGKYGKDERKIAVTRIALSFQTVETINESALSLLTRYPTRFWPMVALCVGIVAALAVLVLLAPLFLLARRLLFHRRRRTKKQ